MTNALTDTRGDTVVKTGTLRDRAGALYDFTGCTVFFTVKEPDDTHLPDDSDALVKLYWVDSPRSSNGITISNLTNGVLVVKIPAAITATMAPNRLYRYDVQVINAAGEVDTPDRGTLQFDADVTTRVATP